MSDNNLEAERAAPELLPCPFCGGTNIDPAEWSGNDGKFGPGCGDCGALAESAEDWNRRAASVVGDDGLPQLPEADEYSATRMLPNGELAPRFNGTTLRQYARAAIAADRAARAQQQAQSIGDDPKFQMLIAEYGAAGAVADHDHTPATVAAMEAKYRALIAYIDGRTAGAGDAE